MSVCLISIIQNLRMKSTLILVCIVSLVRTTTFLMVDIWWMGLKRWWSTAQYQWVTLDGEGYSGSWFWDNNKEVHDTIGVIKIKKIKQKISTFMSIRNIFVRKCLHSNVKEGRGIKEPSKIFYAHPAWQIARGYCASEKFPLWVFRHSINWW